MASNVVAYAGDGSWIQALGVVKCHQGPSSVLGLEDRVELLQL